jgi:hypothetical protein
MNNSPREKTIKRSILAGDLIFLCVGALVMIFVIWVAGEMFQVEKQIRQGSEIRSQISRL